MSEIPEWFWDAVETKPASHFTEIAGIDIHYQTWSEPGKPGLLFVHGHNAHAHWWDFIAPSFADDFHTVALDLSGMGDSDHREKYDSDTFASEILGVAEAAGMPADTIVVAHSFGGIMSLRACRVAPDRFKALILVDSGVKHPEEQSASEVERWSKAKVYPTFDVGKSRFRLQPAQPCDNTWIVEYIARNSLDQITEGWIWKFDEELNSRMTHTGDVADDLRSVPCRVELIHGELSDSFSPRSAAYMQELRPSLGLHPIADARHHVFLDQPLAFIDSLRRVLALCA